MLLSLAVFLYVLRKTRGRRGGGCYRAGEVTAGGAEIERRSTEGPDLDKTPDLQAATKHESRGRREQACIRGKLTMETQLDLRHLNSKLLDSKLQLHE
uniref:Uncharacterized protein n=1 Tax=Knipowitschia caucasica TaxID=637954 RepID=A0AAV2LPK4_KNICA